MAACVLDGGGAASIKKMMRTLIDVVFLRNFTRNLGIAMLVVGVLNLIVALLR